MAKMTLRQMRMLRDITKREMAESLGVNINTYSNWEYCPAKVQVGKLLKVMEILGFRLEELKLFNSNGFPYYEEKGSEGDETNNLRAECSDKPVGGDSGQDMVS